MCEQNLKLVALPVPEIIGVPKKLDSPWIRPRSFFSKIFCGLLLGWTMRMHQQNSKPVALPVPEIIAIEVLGAVTNLQSRKEGIGGWEWYRSKQRWWVPIGSP